MKTLLPVIALLISSTTLLAGADLSVTTVPSSITVVPAGSRRFVSFLIQNNGPDIAKDVIATTSVVGGAFTEDCQNGCPIDGGTLPVGNSSVTVSVLYPDTPGDVSITLSIASSTSDPNAENNRATATITVSSDPDVVTFVAVPKAQDLALPFPLSINLFNQSAVVAHDVDVTVDFRPDTGVKSLPAGCSNPAAGRVVCHVDELDGTPPQPAFVVTLIAPATYGSGQVAFSATATERERDFDPSSNTSHAVMPLANTIYVTTTADSGAGSLRQAILNANAATGPLTIAFRIAEPSTTPWKTIHLLSPFPAVTANSLRIDGATQTGFFGDTNADGPEIEISGGGTIDGDGLVIAACFTEVANLAIGGFGGNGLSVANAMTIGCSSGYYTTDLHHLYVGTDPTGSAARPNGRGIGTSVQGSKDFYDISGRGPTNIHDCVISGNTRSGIFGLSGRLNISNNRIGVKAHADEALPNGASGVFIGPGGYGSDVGPDVFTALNSPTVGGNVIAFNGEIGVAIADGLTDVSVRNNRIWGNKLLGIDIGLDGPTASSKSDSGDPIGMPALTLAHYDPVSNKTIIEGEIPATVAGGVFSFFINLFANDAADPSGYGEGERPLGVVRPSGSHFHFEADGNLTGQLIAATNTRTNYVGFAKPVADGIDQGFLTQTSEFSRWLEVR